MVNGFLNVNKPSGVSSAWVVARVKRICPKGTKVGHMGTLDPMASGVLPIAVGRATRLFDMMQNKQKRYIATFKFGLTTDTLDVEGQTLETTNVIPNSQQIKDALSSFVGKIEQLPPNFSAKSINGVRAYNLARKGQQINLKPCFVEIFDIKLTNELANNEYQFDIVCGSGTYIRSLCRDLAAKLGSLAVMTSLVRIQTGKFDLNNALSIDNISLDKIITIDQIVDAKKILLTNLQLHTLLDGKKLILNEQDGNYLGYYENEIQLMFNIKNKTITNKIWLR